MRQRPNTPIVFAGPSVSGLTTAERAQITLHPPARRGDLETLAAEQAPGTVVLIDGIFGASLAVTPAECRHLLEQGWELVGAASMGALRASDLWLLGMIGIGDVYSLYRLEVLRSDADVAVAYNPDTWSEMTASMVHVRAVIAALEQDAILDEAGAAQTLESAMEIYWCERTWEVLFAKWRAVGVNPAAISAADKLRRNEQLHPKRRDASLAVRSVLARRWI